jgi:competence protein ComEC
VHWLLAIGLVPLLVMWFGQFPLFGACANLLAVPWVSFLVVPLVLCGAALGLIIPAAGAVLFELAARALGLLWPTLEAIATADLAAIHQPAAPAWTFIPAVIGVALLLLPRGVPARWLGAVWLLPLLLPPVARPAIGEFMLTVLDVGQGLAAVVRTRGHTLVFDTGARFSADFDAGSAVLLPYLRHHGISRVDTLIVSHGDNDHIGGARELTAGIRVGRILSSVPERLPGSGALPCVAGQRWRWDGVDFVVLHPEVGYRGSENNRSCVLKIGRGRQSALLAGDIEAAAEQWLVRRRAPELRAAVLIAPHHGSRTSSTPAFIAAVAPRHALFAAGYRNRYGFPKSDIIARYHQHGAQTYITFRHGAIRFDLRSDAAVVTSQRAIARRFWHAGVHD